MDINDNTAVAQKPQTGQSNKKLIIFLVATGVAFAVFLYVFTHATFATGKPYSVDVDGTTILPGKTTVQELADAGFNLSDYSVLYKQAYDLSAEADARTNYLQIALVKDAKIYAHLEVMNKDASPKPLSACIVSNVNFTTTYDYQNDDKIAVNGVSLKDITPDKMIEASGKPFEVSDYKSYDESRTGTEHVWKFHAYEMHVITLDDGSLYQVSSVFD